MDKGKGGGVGLALWGKIKQIPGNSIPLIIVKTNKILQEEETLSSHYLSYPVPREVPGGDLQPGHKIRPRSHPHVQLKCEVSQLLLSFPMEVAAEIHDPYMKASAKVTLVLSLIFLKTVSTVSL